MNTKNKMDNIKTELRLNSAIDKGNMEDINTILSSLPDAEPEISTEELIANTKALSLKEAKIMNNKKTFLKGGIIAAAAVIMACVSVGAAVGIYKTYTFNSEGKYLSLSVSSDSPIDGEKAEKLAKAAADDFEAARENGEAAAADEPKVFNTIEDAEAFAGFKAVLPGAMPKLDLSDAEAQTLYLPDDGSETTMWLNFGSVEDKCMGITITKRSYGEDTIGIYEGDGEATGETFISEKGYVFDILKDKAEDSEETFSMYVTNIGQYEYCLLFSGIDDKEAEKIINSTDLSDYE